MKRIAITLSVFSFITIAVTSCRSSGPSEYKNMRIKELAFTDDSIKVGITIVKSLDTAYKVGDTIEFGSAMDPKYGVIVK